MSQCYSILVLNNLFGVFCRVRVLGTRILVMGTVCFEEPEY